MTRVTSRLPWPTDAILSTVEQHRWATTSQLRRLHYTGTDRGMKVRSSYHLKRLTEVGRLERIWCVYSGEKEYCYFMPGDGPGLDWRKLYHTLDLTELHARFTATCGDQVTFIPEGWFDARIGQVELTADAMVEIGERKFYLEMHEGSEHTARIKEKMRRYMNALDNHWDEAKYGDVFYSIIWVVKTELGRRNVIDARRQLREEKLFKVIWFDEVVGKLTK